MEIAHVVDENISLINITRVEMSENIQALNKIIGSLANLDAKLDNIIQALEIISCERGMCNIIKTIS